MDASGQLHVLAGLSPVLTGWDVGWAPEKVRKARRREKSPAGEARGGSKVNFSNHWNGLKETTKTYNKKTLTAL
jgi:hypothetical protein